MKYVCRDFNALCTELSLQCLIQMNPRDFKLDFHFENLGDSTVALFTDDFFETIPPRGKSMIKMGSEDTPWMCHWSEL